MERPKGQAIPIASLMIQPRDRTVIRITTWRLVAWPFQGESPAAGSPSGAGAPWAAGTGRGSPVKTAPGPPPVPRRKPENGTGPASGIRPTQLKESLAQPNEPQAPDSRFYRCVPSTPACFVRSR